MKLVLNTVRAAAAIAILSLPFAAHADDSYVAYTAALPPYTLGNDLEAPGMAHELVLELSARTGIDIKIEYLPWGRAQTMVQETPNSILFSATRSAAREDLYSWITLMAEPREVFVSMGETINSLEEANGAASIVVLDNTPRHGRLTEAGLTNIQTAREAQLAARMLNGGRVEAWYTFDHRAAFVFNREGFDPATLVFGEAQRSPQNWMAAHPDFDPAIAAQLDAAMAEIRADGTYASILNRYIN